MTDTQPTHLDLDAIQAREQAATPGPWEAFDTDQHWSLHMQGFPMQILKAPKQGTPYAEYWPNDADAAFIVHARTDVPELIAYARHLETRAASLGAERDGWAENNRNEERIWAARVAELEQQLATAQALLPADPAEDINASWISPRHLRAALDGDFPAPVRGDR